MKLGYSCTFETKLIRRKHMVVFRVGMRARDLIESLKNVPPDATVDEVLDGESYGETYEQPCASIEFHEEVVERE